MARIRTIKPDFFTSADIVGLSPLARLLYIATWCEADKEGRMVWRPATFKLRYLPGDSCDIDALCDEIVAAGLVVLYGDGLAYIPAFARHQHINPRESVSELPDPHAKPGRRNPPARTTATPPRDDDSSERDEHASPRVDHASARVSTRPPRAGRKGREGNVLIQPPHPPDEQGGAFDRFWVAWPSHRRKAAKDQCRRKWASKGCEGIADRVLAALEAAKSSASWAKDKGKYIPAPLTWLNQARWDAPTDDQAEADHVERHWHETRSGIEGKGVEVGVGRWDEDAFQHGSGEPFAAYESRVRRAAMAGVAA